MKFHEAWDYLPFEAKMAITKRVILYYLIIALVFWLPPILAIIIHYL